MHDHEELPLSFGAHQDLSELLEYVERFEEHGDAWVAYMEDQRHNLPSEENFNDRYAGSADSEIDWIGQHLDDCGALDAIQKKTRYYFDNERYLRDMQLGSEMGFVRVGGAVYAFWG